MRPAVLLAIGIGLLYLLFSGKLLRMITDMTT